MTTGPDTADEEGASLIAAITNRRRQWVPLSPDQANMVDAYVAGQLAGEAAAATEKFVHDNAFAAERVVERLLVLQAASGPAPSRALTESILRRAERATARQTPVKRPFWATLPSWRIAGAAAVTGAVLFLGAELLLNPAHSPSGIGQGTKEANDAATVPSVQVAMATIPNRDLLVESSDEKLRSTPGRSGNATSRNASETTESVVPRFYDIEVPSDLLSSWMARARSGSPIPTAELQPLVGRLQTSNASQDSGILFDEALFTRMPQPTPPGVPKQTSAVELRIYDLKQDPSDDLRKGINIQTTQKLAARYFVTVRP